MWFMRQAGRYLPEYRAVRSKHSFLEMVRSPELVAEVTVQPVDLVGVDAAIIFSDILVVPEAMGMQLVVEEGKGGPRFPEPIRLYKQIKELKERLKLTVLMAEQNFHQAVRIADRGYVIVHGKIEFEGGSADELNNNDLIRKFYLGL